MTRSNLPALPLGHLKGQTSSTASAKISAATALASFTRHTLLHQTLLDCFTRSCICGRQLMIAVLAADDLKVEVGLTAQQHRPKDAPVYTPYCTGPGSVVTPKLIIRQDAGMGAHTCDGLGHHQLRRAECYFRFRKDSLLFLAGSPLSPPLSSQSRTTIDKALFKTSDAR